MVACISTLVHTDKTSILQCDFGVSSMCQTTAEKYSINTYKGCLAAELSSTCLFKHLIFMEVTQYVVTAHRRDELHHLFLYRNMITAM